MNEKPEDFVLLVGKHKGKSLSEIASTDDGLLYLDWLVGQDWLWPDTKVVIEEFLNDDEVQRDLDRLLEDKT